jgi:hypothetical protein
VPFADRDKIEAGEQMVGRRIYQETPCDKCVPLDLMPINLPAFDLYMMCKNQYIIPPSGKPFDVDMGSVSSTALACGYDRDTVIAVVNLMRVDLEDMQDG